MKEQITPLLGIVITALLSAWKLDAVKKSTFDLFGKLPRALQWVPAVVVGMLATGGQGYLDGLSGSDLFTFAASNGAEAGALAIAIWHVVKRFKKEAVAPISALLFVGLIGFGNAGCGRASVEAKINAVQEVEDQAIVQVGYLKSVFDVAVSNPAIPADKQLEYRQKFAEAHAAFEASMAKKGKYLREALEANTETIDFTALVSGISEGVLGIIRVLDVLGANPLFIHEQNAKAMSLSRGI